MLWTRADLSFALVNNLELLTHYTKHAENERCFSRQNRDEKKTEMRKNIQVERNLHLQRGTAASYKLRCSLSVPAYGWDDFMDGTLSRQLVCTGIFFVRSDFLAFLSSAAPGASHQHGAEVLRRVRTYRHGPTYETPRRPPVENRVGSSRETLEKRLEKTPSNACCFAQGSSLMC